jgi:hypothetical protein
LVTGVIWGSVVRERWGVPFVGCWIERSSGEETWFILDSFHLEQQRWCKDTLKTYYRLHQYK